MCNKLVCFNHHAPIAVNLLLQYPKTQDGGDNIEVSVRWIYIRRILHKHEQYFTIPNKSQYSYMVFGAICSMANRDLLKRHCARPMHITNYLPHA